MNEVMEREIRAQAEVLPAMLAELVSIVSAVPPPRGRVFAGGCGDSAFAPAALAGFFRELGLEIGATTAMELASFVPLQAGDTVVLSSISGNTRRTAEAAEAARRKGARVVALTCGENSLLAKAADDLVMLPFAPISRKTPHTLDYAATLLALAVLGLRWKGGDPLELGEALARIPAMIERGRTFADEIASGMANDAACFLLGAGPDLATAAYGAAKFHEAGGQAAVAAETEQFIHGMNFMVEPGDALIAVAIHLASLQRGTEVAEAFGAFVPNSRVLAPARTGLAGLADGFARLLDVTIALQLLCWHRSCRLGIPVDAPRGGRPNAREHVTAQNWLMGF